MTADKIIVLISGISGIVFTGWFFLFKPDRVTEVQGSVDIRVAGGYSPDVIRVPAGRPVVINFTRTEDNSCLEEIVISDFKIRKFLPLGKTVSLTVTPQKPGVYPFACGMNMFHGKLIAI